MVSHSASSHRSSNRSLVAALLGLALLVLGLPALAQGGDDSGHFFQGAERLEKAAEVDRLVAIQDKVQDEILATAGVVGMGITLDRETGELVFVISKDKNQKLAFPVTLPKAIEGVPVVEEEIEPLVAMNGGGGCIPCHANQVALPVPMGNSGFSRGVCGACTLGFKACYGNRAVYVTNAHCSTNGTGCEGSAAIGSDTQHRSGLDAACAFTTDIGDVSGHATPICGLNNRVDGARILSPNTLTSRSIRDIGTPSTVAGTVLPGDVVQKSGRTTGYTTGQVTSVNFAAAIGGYCCGAPVFVGQIRVDAFVLPFIQGGDSGSALLNLGQPPQIVGLLFAGSTNGAIGLANPINNVTAALGISLNTSLCQ